jgi:DNA-binding MurR/RpiR family transcriptional regulator
VARRPTPEWRAPDAANAGNVIEELRLRYDLLTHSQKRIADYIVDHSQVIAFSTVDEMAARLGVNPSTIVRFCYRLGLNGFPGLQGRMRQVVRDQLLRAHEQIEAGASSAHFQGTTFGDSFVQDILNLQRTITGLTEEDDFNRAVDRLVAAGRIYVIADFCVFALAHYFGLVLSRVCPDVQTLAADGGVSRVRLAEIASSDCLVAFTFPPYAHFTRRAALWARERKAAIIAITDTPISALGQIADAVLVAAPTGAGLQYSMVAPMAVANALLNGVTAAKGTAALDRYSHSDALFDEWNSFQLKSDPSAHRTSNRKPEASQDLSVATGHGPDAFKC